MSKRCEFIEGCSMVKYFCRAAEIVYKNVYCEGGFKTCARYKTRMAGQPVPENLLPQGITLWPDGETPPEEFYLS